MKLVVVESPAKAKTINKYLGKDYQVEASYGHICDLPSKNGSVIPEANFEMKYEVSLKSQKHVKKLVDIAKKCDEILLATDPDREGEAISWHVIEVLRDKKAIKKDTIIKRVAFNEITKKAILAAINSPRDVDINLVESQQARRALDYLVGFNLSPVLWRKLPGSRSAGRVQSVALKLICERENEIEKFISREYWDIFGNFDPNSKKNLQAKLTHIKGKKLDKFSLENEKIANEVKNDIPNFNYKVEKLETKEQKRNPTPPFTTSTLQQEASRKLGYSTKKTMQIAQKLYEGIDIDNETVGLITYMRTDGVTLSEDSLNQIREYILQKIGKDYLPSAKRQYKSKDKNAQEAHEAIRPTDINIHPSSVQKYLSKDELRLYDLIWKRTVACQMESAILEIASADIADSQKNYILRATGSILKFDGFYKIYREDIDDPENDSEDDGQNSGSDEDKLLPPLFVGQELGLKSVEAKQHFTEPPPRYTEASLVKKLEELGIGRPSTYSSIISVIQDRNYVRLDKKKFFPEQRGRIVTTFLNEFFKKYVEYDFTANLEDQLDLVAEGKNNKIDLLQNFWVDFYENVKSVTNIKNTDILESLNNNLADQIFPVTKENPNPRKCPSCEDGLLGLRIGKFGAFIACSNYPTCDYKRQIQNSNDSSGDQDGDISEDKPAKEQDLLLGQNKNAEDIWLKKGPYGYYIQEGEGKDGKKPKRSPLPPIYKPADVNLDIGLRLLSLPILLGVNPNSSEEMLIGIGKYGPYIKHGKKFTSIPKKEDPFSISFDRAVEIIGQYEKK